MMCQEAVYESGEHDLCVQFDCSLQSKTMEGIEDQVADIDGDSDNAGDGADGKAGFGEGE